MQFAILVQLKFCCHSTWASKGDILWIFPSDFLGNGLDRRKNSEKLTGPTGTVIDLYLKHVSDTCLERVSTTSFLWDNDIWHHDDININLTPANFTWGIVWCRVVWLSLSSFWRTSIFIWYSCGRHQLPFFVQSIMIIVRFVGFGNKIREWYKC